MSKRNRTLAFGLLGIVTLALLTFPLWSPLLRNDVVDEPFPELNAAEQAEFEAMPQAERDLFISMKDENPDMALQTLRAQLGEDDIVPEDQRGMPENMPEDPVILKQGSFIRLDAIHGAEGSATIYELTDGSHIIRFEDFRSTNGPDLHVVLSSAEDPRSHDALGDNYLDLGVLKGNVGNQNYEIPAGINLDEYNSVVIYCLPFRVVFSTATLS